MLHQLKLVLESQYVRDKASIMELIKEFNCWGVYCRCKRHQESVSSCYEKTKIEGGNNQVIIATDGAFNLDLNLEIRVF